MKKILYAVAAFALILTGCAKEIDHQEKDSFSKVRLHVTVADNMTKVSADNNGRYHWQAGDAITVFNDSDDPFEFSTVEGGSYVDFGATSWSGTLGKYAMYPASADHEVAGDEIQFNLPSSYEWTADATNMPMLGKISGDVATFKAVGGVLKLVCYNIPTGAAKLWFVSSSSRITGDFSIADASVSDPDPVIASESANDDVLEISFAYSENKVFYIPLPTGDIGGFEIYFYDSSDIELFSKSTGVTFTVGRNEMIIAPALNCGESGTTPEDADLTNEQIIESDLVYNTYTAAESPVTISNTYGDWVISGAKGGNHSSSGNYFVQIRNNTTVSYIKLPEFKNQIATVVLQGVCNGNEGQYNGNIYFRTAADNDGEAVATGSSKSVMDDVTLTIPSGYKTGYIMSSGGCLITSIKVTFIGGTPAVIPTISVGSSSATINKGNLKASISEVVLNNPIDGQGIAVVYNADWIESATIGDDNKLSISANSYNWTEGPREATISLKATGAETVNVTVKQNASIVSSPELTATPDDATFSVSWTGDSKAASYVGYYSTEENLADPTTGIALTITNEGTAYTASPSETVVNGTTYYIYVKVGSTNDDKYKASSVWAKSDVTPKSGSDPVTVTKTINQIVQDNGYNVSSGNTINDIITSFALDSYITVSTSGDANCGSFWGTTTYDWRLYQNKSGDITISASGGKIITKVTITYNVSNKGTLKSGNTTISSGSEQTVNASSVTYTVGNTGNETSGQVRVTQISVTYN